MAARRLTVVQVLPALVSGGVERGTLEVAAALVQRGHRSIVISAGGPMVDELQAAGSEHVQWPIGHKSLLTLRYVRRLRRFLRQEQVDIVHARSRLPAWIAHLALRAMPAAVRPHFVTTVHGFYSVGRYSAIMTRGERVIAVSEAIARYVRQHYEVPPQRLTVIHRGVDRSQFPYHYRPDEDWLQRWYRDFPQLRQRRVLTLPGRLTRLKGHEDFLRLMAALVAAQQPVHGLIVGGEDPRRRAYAESLQQQVQTLGLQSHVTFTGVRSDMREIYAASDLVLSLSGKPESFGRTVVEALSLGVPVIGYDHGGVGEILRTVYPAGLVSFGDGERLRKKVEDMLAAAPAVPPDHPFELAPMLARTLELYESIGSASGPGVAR